MFPRIKVLYSKDYAANLRDVGGFPQKQSSIFNNLSTPAKSDDSKSPQKLQQSAEEEEDNAPQTANILCGRIRFEDIPIPPSAPQDLICEECETKFSSFYCEACKQVFCTKCADMCHPRISQNELLHDHEQRGWIRTLKPGDVSKVQKPDNIYPPDTLCYYEDFMQIRDISKPNSLSTGQQLEPKPLSRSSSPASKKQNLTTTPPPRSASSIHKTLPTYRSQDLVLFKDPTTKEDMYGKIISQWDQIYTTSAPAIIRGQDSSYYYHIHSLGKVKDIGDPQKFYNQYKENSFMSDKNNEEESSSSNVQDQQDMDSINQLPIQPLTQEIKQAREINKRILDHHTQRLIGPKYHLRDVAQRDALYQPPIILTYNSATYGGNTLNNAVLKQEDLFTKEDYTTFHFQTQLEEVNQKLKEENIDVYADINEHETGIHNTSVHYKPLPAAARSYQDYLVTINANSTGEVEKSGTGVFDIIILPQKQLGSMEEYLKRLVKKKHDIIDRVFIKHDQMITLKMVQRRFTFWKDSMEELKERKRQFCARRIQTRARVWLCRDKLQECIDYWAEYHEMKRQAVHDQFRISTSDDPYAVSVDGKKFFATHADINRYSHFLLVCILHICKFMMRKRDFLLKRSLILWKKAIYDYTEADMQNNHIDEVLLLRDMIEHSKLTFKQAQEEIMSQYQSLVPVFQSHVTDQNANNGFVTPTKEKLFDPFNHEKVSSLALRTSELSPYFKSEVMSVPPFSPLNNLIDSLNPHSVEEGRMIKKDDWELLPSYNPSHKMQNILPPLISIHAPKSFKDRLYYHISLQKNNLPTHQKADKSSASDTWRVSMEGPTSDSYWLIPHVLCIGQAPFGVAERTKMLIVSTNIHEDNQDDILKDDNEEDNHSVVPLTAGMKAIGSLRTSSSKMKKSKEKIALTAISALLLHGVDCFLSLLTEEEESYLESVYGTESIHKQIEQALASTRENANEVMFHNQEIITKQEKIIEGIPNYGRTDPRYPAAYRQKLRCQARIELAKSNINRIKQQIGKLPEKIMWRRLDYLSKRRNQNWNIDDVLPSLWQIEELMRERKCIYMYSYGIHINNTHIQTNMASLTDQEVYYPIKPNGSVHNHDRIAIDDSAGLLGAMVVGRVYHIEPYEVMFRWQSSHDTMKSIALLPIAKEYNTYYHISCPSLPWKKNLLIDVLRRTHYALQYPTIRSQENPEIFKEFERDEYDSSLRDQIIAQYDVRKPPGAAEERSEGDRQEDLYANETKKRWKQSLYFK